MHSKSINEFTTSKYKNRQPMKHKQNLKISCINEDSEQLRINIGK